ncbi:MAG: FHA domain-containing protein [Kofleriaceae bacterium]|nr:FHA domain-containing protein [Kofleriaceae bacterium]
MIVCKRCDKENQDHYKFCLGCGAEISPSDGESAGVMKTIMADASSPVGAPVGAPMGAPVGPPPGVGLPAAPMAQPMAPMAQPMAPMAQPMAPMAQPMAPMAQPMAPMAQPMAPMAQPMAPAAQPIAPAAPAPAVQVIQCPSCQAEIPSNNKFCGTCGTSIEVAPTPAPVAAPTPVAAPALQATMTLIRPDGSEGGTHALHEGVNKLGRNHGDIFETDGYLSPTHGELHISASGTHLVRDLNSLNGVFVRMTEEEELTPGQIIRIGQELLRFDLIDTPPQSPDGTEVMGSPNPGYWGCITVIIGQEVSGAAFPLLGDAITMGREHGDINFPDDGYVSGMHARLVTRDDKVYLSDMGSSNGTFMKVSGERQVPNNSFVLLGQQLFRITVDQ